MGSDLELSSGFQPKHIFTLSDKFKQIAYIGMEELVFLVLVNTFWVRVAFFLHFQKMHRLYPRFSGSERFVQGYVSSWFHLKLGGGFKYVLFSPLPGEFD